MKKTIFLIAILSMFALTACQKASTETQSNVETSAVQNEIKQVTVEQTRDAIEAKSPQFIDVRTTEEYMNGHAPKTVNIPLDSLETGLAKLDKNKPVYVICQTGRRSQKGAEILQKAGFSEIYNVQGGTSAWIDAELPIEN